MYEELHGWWVRYALIKINLGSKVGLCGQQVFSFVGMSIKKNIILLYLSREDRNF